MIVKKNSKVKKKLSASEIMERVIDVEELEKRKQTLIKEESSLKEEKIVTIKEKQWWEFPMKKTFFKIEKYEDKFYAQYKDWNENIWIGPYDSEKQLNAVIKSYVEETKKPVMNRNIENIHSIVLKIKK